jgi:hypothetical protein
MMNKIITGLLAAAFAVSAFATDIDEHLRYVAENDTTGFYIVKDGEMAPVLHNHHVQFVAVDVTFVKNGTNEVGAVNYTIVVSTCFPPKEAVLQTLSTRANADAPFIQELPNEQIGAAMKSKTFGPVAPGTFFDAAVDAACVTANNG